MDRWILVTRCDVFRWFRLKVRRVRLWQMVIVAVSSSFFVAWLLRVQKKRRIKVVDLTIEGRGSEFWFLRFL